MGAECIHIYTIQFYGDVTSMDTVNPSSLNVTTGSNSREGHYGEDDNRVGEKQHQDGDNESGLRGGRMRKGWPALCSSVLF